MPSQPFDDIRSLIHDLPPAPAAAQASAAGPVLARMADWIAAWRGGAQVNRPIFALYVGGHAGVDQAGTSRQLMERIAAGDADISRAAQHLGAGLDVYELAIDRPVPDLTASAAMSERECAATMAFGMEALAKQPDLLCVGALGGEGRLIAAAALAHARFGGAAADWTPVAQAGRVAAAVERARTEAGDDPLQQLRQLGGRETAAACGAILAARTQAVPVLLGDYPGLAAAAVLGALDALAIDHCRLACAPAAPGARRLADALGLVPWLDLDLEADDGTGCAAALSLIRLACAIPAHGAP
jgi:nicotinate-nucleotide--dimethylbenzimidazole phosphoribosyltransferase